MPDRNWRFKPGNKEKEKARLAADYQRRKEEIGIKRKARYANNKEIELARNKAWSDQNREHHRAINRQWSKTNPVAARALVARRRARLHDVGGHYNKDDVSALMETQSGLCVICQADIRLSFHVDHKTPISKGGSNWPSNLQLLCPLCNRKKGSKLIYIPSKSEASSGYREENRG